MKTQEKSYTYRSMRCPSCRDYTQRMAADDEDGVVCDKCGNYFTDRPAKASVAPMTTVFIDTTKPTRIAFCPICTNRAEMTRQEWLWIGHCEPCDRGFMAVVTSEDLG